MFERFTAEARDVVVNARLAAEDLGHQFIGTEHVLLALVTDPAGPVATALRADGIDDRYVRAEIVRRASPSSTAAVDPVGDEEEDAAALKAIGIDLEAVRRAVEASFGEGSLRLPRDAGPTREGFFARLYGGGGHIRFTKRNKKVLELSLREAVALNQKFIAPEHLMLGLLREGNGLGVLILADRGVDLDRVRGELTRSLQSRAA